jgi:C-terminal processing protease CtpA/Prc
LEVVGLELKETDNPNLSAQYFGFTAIKKDGKIIIKRVEPNSIADKNEMAPEDEITKVNGKKIEKKLSEVLNDEKKEITFTIKKKFAEKPSTLATGNYSKLFELVKKEKTTEEQLILRKVWCNN